MGAAGAILGVLLAAGCSSSATRPPEPRGDALQLEIEKPEAYAAVRTRSGRLLVSGRIQRAGAPQPPPRALAFLLDVSAASDEPSGQDTDGDGELGFHPGRYLRILQPSDYTLHCTDPDDTILSTELGALQRIIQHVGGDRHARFVLVPFSSRLPATSPPPTPVRHAPRTEAKLRKRLELIHDGAAIKRRSLDAALLDARASLSALGGTRATIVVFTALPGPVPRSSVPPHPRGPGPSPWTAAMHRLTEASSSEIHVLGFGPRAIEPPPEIRSFAERSGAQYLGVEKPWEIAALFTGPLSSLVGSFEISNGEAAPSADVVVSGDGRFSGHVELHEGVNRVRITLESPLPVSGETIVEVHFARRKPRPWELLVDLARVQDRNRALYRLIEREKALRNADDDAHDIELHVE
ncbi:MAG: hypothetical protein ACE5FG_03225 [Myxococcota bacterium]